MPNQVLSAAILRDCYNSRALITHRFDSHNILRNTNGDLWAIFRRDYRDETVELHYSSDDGFSWTVVWSDDIGGGSISKSNTSGLNLNGPAISIVAIEESNILKTYHPYEDVDLSGIGEGTYGAFFRSFNISNPLAPTIVETYDIPNIMFQMSLDVSANNKTTFLSYTKSNNFIVKTYTVTGLVKNTVTKTGFYLNLFKTCAHEDGYLDIVSLADTGASTYQLCHLRYDQNSTSFSSGPNIIQTFGGLYNTTDISLARDGYDNLCAFWSIENAAGTDLDVYYSISQDNGVIWSTPAIINKTAGHSVFTDTATGNLAGRSTIISGVEGFVISYVRNNADSIPKTFVRTLLTEDGTTYTLGTEKQIATLMTQSDEAVVGLKWFKTPGTALMSLSDPGLVRVAYQIGEGNSTTQNDSVPVRVYQELLNVSAYPDETISSGSYVIDVPASNELALTVNVVGSPSDNIDYYAEGLTGNVTTKYLDAFDKAGLSVVIKKYSPQSNSQMDDITSYSSAEVFNARILMDPGTYEAPLADRGNDGFTTYIERDIRKVYIPPNFHLSREFVVNKGGFLKRTIWTLHFDGNQYELSQVIPYFIDQKIAYYSANAYVVGPSNNPFTKRILPSET